MPLHFRDLRQHQLISGLTRADLQSTHRDDCRRAQRSCNFVPPLFATAARSVSLVSADLKGGCIQDGTISLACFVTRLIAPADVLPKQSNNRNAIDNSNSSRNSNGNSNSNDKHNNRNATATFTTTTTTTNDNDSYIPNHNSNAAQGPREEGAAHDPRDGAPQALFFFLLSLLLLLLLSLLLLLLLLLLFILLTSLLVS